MVGTLFFVSVAGDWYFPKLKTRGVQCNEAFKRWLRLFLPP